MDKRYHKARRAAQIWRSTYKVGDKIQLGIKNHMSKTDRLIRCKNALRGDKAKRTSAEVQAAENIVSMILAPTVQDPIKRTLQQRIAWYRWKTHTTKAKDAVTFYMDVWAATAKANNKCRNRCLSAHDVISTIIEAAKTGQYCEDNGGIVTASSYGYPWTTTCVAAKPVGDTVEVGVWRGKPGGGNYEMKFPRHLLMSLNVASCLRSEVIGIERAKMVERYNEQGERTGIAIPMPQDLRGRFGGWEHGVTYIDAHREIARKRQILQQEIVEAANRAASEKQLRREERRARLFARLSNIEITYTDIRGTGACDPGINAWCKNKGISVDARVPLSVLAHDSQSYPYAVIVARKKLAELRHAA